MQKNVLITGASTGIGFAAVKMLVENGFSAIATVRKLEDENNLLKGNISIPMNATIWSYSNFTWNFMTK